MKITIITALWHADNIPAVIESVDNQTYQDFQHILVNDNNENVRKVFKGVCDGVKRHWIDFGVRCHYYGAMARNTGVMSAFSYCHHSKRDRDNEWILFHDDDNKWEPYHVEAMVNAVKRRPKSTMVVADSVWVGAKDKEWKTIRKAEFRHGGCDLGQFMYKTELFRKYGYFDPHPGLKHKYDWVLLKKMTEGEEGNIIFTGEPSFIMNYKKR